MKRLIGNLFDKFIEIIAFFIDDRDYIKATNDIIEKRLRELSPQYKVIKEREELSLERKRKINMILKDMKKK